MVKLISLDGDLLRPVNEERQALLTGLRLMADRLSPKAKAQVLADLEEQIEDMDNLPNMQGGYRKVRELLLEDRS